MRSPLDIKENFALHGISIRDWAQAYGFSESLVYAVLSGRNKASRGQSFKIAVALGLKAAPSLTCAPDYIREVLLSQTDKEVL
ncbi:DNA-binding protein [Comamonas guangdongensis]|uniref:DNA-binding protein n=1 Tax=Comamonas guangdongensis TaxID=510515 RepID=A0ABV4A110_9BURK